MEIAIKKIKFARERAIVLAFLMGGFSYLHYTFAYFNRNRYVKLEYRSDHMKTGICTVSIHVVLFIIEVEIWPLMELMTVNDQDN